MFGSNDVHDGPHLVCFVLLSVIIIYSFDDRIQTKLILAFWS